MTSKAQDVANAYRMVATDNHYLVGVVLTGFCLNDFFNARQLLVEEQNQCQDGSDHFRMLDLALDLMESDEDRVLP